MIRASTLAALGLASALAAMPAAAHFAGGPGQYGPDCPGYGQGMMGPGMMGPGMMGQGMGPGMMGPGMMGQGMGPGMMGQGMMGQGMMGQGMAQQPLPRDLTGEEVRHMFEHRLAMNGNPNLKLGPVTEKDADTITVDVVTQEDSLVDRYEVDRHTGAWHAVR